MGINARRDLFESSRSSSNFQRTGIRIGTFTTMSFKTLTILATAIALSSAIPSGDDKSTTTPTIIYRELEDEDRSSGSASVSLGSVESGSNSMGGVSTSSMEVDDTMPDMMEEDFGNMADEMSSEEPEIPEPEGRLEAEALWADFEREAAQLTSDDEISKLAEEYAAKMKDFE